MSYKKRKLKKSRIKQLTFQLGMFGSVLLQKIRSRWIRRKEMRLPQTTKVMEFLRERNKLVSPNNQKVDEWIDNYINSCGLSGKPVEILTQWCSGLGLGKRKVLQGGRFQPLSAEIKIFQEEIPRILKAFNKNGFKVSWIITFNRSYIERRRLPDMVFKEYLEMINGLAKAIPEIKDSLLLLDWEEVLSQPIEPNSEILEKFNDFVGVNALEYEIKTFLRMLQQYPDSLESEKELRLEAQRRIAFESEEGKFLAGPDSPFRDGRFILIPLERPERYIFFSIFIPGFEKRIASILKPYPWRMNLEVESYPD